MQHADQQLRIDRWPPGVAVVISKLVAQIGERSSREDIDAAEQMIGWNAVIEMKLVEQSRLIRRPPPHHRQAPSLHWRTESLFVGAFNGVLQHNRPTADVDPKFLNVRTRVKS